jgi:peptidoglycan/xylan/chitin deacetylase (PgdA/CDA1 family)
MHRCFVLAALGLAAFLAIGEVLAHPFEGRSLYERWREDRSGKVLYRGPSTRRVVSLTFDDGPDPRYTPRILDILKAEHIHATFFVVGQRLAAHPELGRRIVSEGHLIGNHTDSHTSILRESARKAREEIDACDSRIEQITGLRTHLFRPPKGLWDEAGYRSALSSGHTLVLWSLAFDRSALRMPGRQGQRVVRLASPGDIVLMHDGSASTRDERAATVRELPAVIAGLRKRGFGFVSVTEMLRIAGDDPWRPPATQRRS